MTQHESFAFDEIFPDYTSLPGETLPSELTIDPEGLFRDTDENIIVFRGLQKAFDPTMLHNGDAPDSIRHAFYGPGLYTSTTQAGLRPFNFKGDTLLLKVEGEARIADLRTMAAAHKVGGLGLAATTAAVKWAGATPQITHKTLKRHTAAYDAALVAPSATFNYISPLTTQPVPGGRLRPQWMVVRNSGVVTPIGKRERD